MAKGIAYNLTHQPSLRPRIQASQPPKVMLIQFAIIHKIEAGFGEISRSYQRVANRLVTKTRVTSNVAFGVHAHLNQASDSRIVFTRFCESLPNVVGIEVETERRTLRTPSRMTDLVI